MRKIVVVGGGAAGMMAAIKAAERGNRVILIEKNEKLGKKLFITGKGRCNVTTNKDIEDIIKHIPGNSSFMYSSLYTFTNQDLMKMIEDKGVKLKVERGDRVFPESDKSSDIIKCFEKYLKENNVEILLNTAVKDILTEDRKVIGVELDVNRSIKCDAVILATGGMSYPLTGSTGDGYEFLRRLGHTIMPIKPALVPLVAKEKWIKELMGLSLKNVELTVKSNNKTIYNDFGEMLFTHFGISGPMVLSASRKVSDILPKEVEIFIDLKPALDYNELDKRILKDFEKFKNKHFKNALDELLPSKLIPVVVDLSEISPEKPVNSISKEERSKLVRLLKEFKVTVIGTRPIEEAIITRGGVNVKEINPSTMESKIIKDLYVVGELLDVDAETGGFNLQIAFSTGYCAGISC
ncbi:FAD-dependent oxidoreductase [Fervidicella metallireducens AeB]|uniref:FAD-dependent oxidoreductase n=1 Tax=Fervidicella metallireducens AeB TaxID=1403537 RepID=A0A017RUE1_9CLOT|nr:NAD(P)/FAD-dependent oxidoreductase [Fervidicella metallireducens]EYE88393.1 FAD-dependent oxidoreductase [Fervidicella metallireducens AeB]